MSHHNREHFRRMSRQWHRRSVFRRAWEKKVRRQTEAWVAACA